MIPPDIKEADEFQRCSICPERRQTGLCGALRPVLPFLEHVDKYASFDKVTAVYRVKGQEVLNVAATTMQIALSYVVLLTLMYYCLNGREYWRYYFGVVPLAGAETVVARVYLNIYWLPGS